jgi:hypothetical protein
VNSLVLAALLILSERERVEGSSLGERRKWFDPLRSLTISGPQGIHNSFRTHRRGGDLWTVQVDLSGRRVEVAGGLGTEPAEVRLHHAFAAAPVSYEDFKRRYPPVTSWTR